MRLISYLVTMCLCGGIAVLSAAPAPAGVDQFRAPGEVLALAASPDGQLAAVGTYHGHRLIWEYSEGKFVARQREKTLGGVTWLAFAPDGRSLLVRSSWQGVTMQTVEGRTIRDGTEESRREAKRCLAVGRWPNHSHLGQLSTVQRLRVSDLAETACYALDVDTLRAVGPSASGRGIVAIDCDLYTGKDRLLSFSPERNMKPLHVWKANGRGIRNARFTDDGKHLAAIRDDRIELWDVAARDCLASLDTGVRCPCSPCVSPELSALAISDLEHTIIVWRSKDGSRHVVSTPYDGKPHIPGFVEPVLFAAGKPRLVVGLHDGRVLIHDWRAKRNLRFLTGPRSPVTVLTCSADGKWVFAGCRDGTVWRWPMP